MKKAKFIRDHAFFRCWRKFTEQMVNRTKIAEKILYSRALQRMIWKVPMNETEMEFIEMKLHLKKVVIL